jgi:hypothetical protein
MFIRRPDEPGVRGAGPDRRSGGECPPTGRASREPRDDASAGLNPCGTTGERGTGDDTGHQDRRCRAGPSTARSVNGEIA